jgi:beta-xylosidase
VTWFDVFGEQQRGQEVIDPHLFIDDDGSIYL